MCDSLIMQIQKVKQIFFQVVILKLNPYRQIFKFIFQIWSLQWQTLYTNLLNSPKICLFILAPTSTHHEHHNLHRSKLLLRLMFNYCLQILNFKPLQLATTQCFCWKYLLTFNSNISLVIGCNHKTLLMLAIKHKVCCLTLMNSLKFLWMKLLLFNWIALWHP